MKQYVLCYAHPDAEWSKVLLIEKTHPEWQRGRYNLPGGKIEEGETVHEAASRELHEETDLDCPPENVRIMGTIEGNDFIVYVCRCDYKATASAESMTDERVFWLPLVEALDHTKLIENLRLIIPFCRVGLTGWHIVAENSGMFIITKERNNAEANIS